MTTAHETARNARPRRPTLDRPHWSYSQIAQYLRCPLQFFFERVAKLPRKHTPSGMAFGSAIHEALACYHSRLQAGEETTEAKVAETFVESWETNKAQRPIQFREDETPSKLLAQGLALLKLYQAEPPPANIIGVEQLLVAPLITSQGEYLEKPLVAVLDLLQRDPERGLLVNEFKTSGRRFSEFEADDKLQATCYAHAVQQQYDQPATIRYTVLVKTKTPSIQHLETARADDELTRLGDLVQSVERAIQAQAFFPIESAMNCSGCAYRRECRGWHGNGTRSEQAPGRETLPC